MSNDRSSSESEAVYLRYFALFSYIRPFFVVEELKHLHWLGKPLSLQVLTDFMLVFFRILTLFGCSWAELKVLPFLRIFASSVHLHGCQWSPWSSLDGSKNGIFEASSLIRQVTFSPSFKLGFCRILPLFRSVLDIHGLGCRIFFFWGSVFRWFSSNFFVFWLTIRLLQDQRSPWSSFVGSDRRTLDFLGFHTFWLADF